MNESREKADTGPDVVIINPPPRTRFAIYAVVMFWLLTLGVLWAAFRILTPFLTPMLLAIVVVTLTYRTYERLLLQFRGRRNLAATVMLLFVTIVLVIPAVILASLLIQEAVTLFMRIEQSDYRGFFSSLRIEERISAIQRWAPWVRLDQARIEELAMNIVRQVPAIVATQGTRLIAGFFGLFIGFLLMLLASFVFYTEGAKMIGELKVLSPLPDEWDEHILRKFRGVADATFRGQLLTALAQGFVAGIGLAITGVPGAALWGGVSAIFSLIPMVGAAAVWLPASLFLAFNASQGDIGWWKPIFLLAWGFGVVSLVDNLVRPMVMRSGVNMHPIILFFAILGGLQAFGFTGLFLGPLVFVLLVTLIEIYKTALAPDQEVPEPAASPADPATPAI
ncbi:MAG TPA: AI-2E family transporter [Thermoanaerobaculia bacterium]|nr:AI-2E family transporter [Thermoanaerobaculia bacterium]